MTALNDYLLIALAISARSPAAYEALKSFEILQLPSRSPLQSYTSAFLHEPGTTISCIADQVAQYVLFGASLSEPHRMVVFMRSTVRLFPKIYVANADSVTHVARLSVWLAMQRAKKREQRDSDEEERQIG